MIMSARIREVLVLASNNSIIQVASVFLANLFTLFFRAKLDPDATHDGIIYPAAIVVSQGGIPNRDVFTQYGPFSHIIHGYWLKLTEQNLLSLRYFTGFVLAISFTMAFLILKPRLGSYLSLLLVLILNLSAPLFLPSLLPWPSVITSLITMVTLIFFRNLNLKANSSRTNFAVAIVFFATTLGVFIRIHLIINLILLALLFLYFALTSKIPKSYAFSAFVGFCASAFSISLYFNLTNSWNDFFYQSLRFPFQSFGEKDGFFTFRQLILYLTNLYLYLLAAAILGLLVLMWRRATSGSRVLSLDVVCFLIFLIASLLVSRLNVETSSFKNPIYLIVYSATSVLQSLNLLTLVVSFWISLKNLMRWRSLDWNRCLALVTGAAVFTQLYPAPDPLHVWWISPVLISVIAMQILCSDLTLSLNLRIRRIRALLIGCLIILSFQQMMIHAQARVEYETNFLTGMFGIESIVAPIDRTLELLEKNKSTYQIRYHCGEGIFSAAGNYFDTREPYFLDILKAPNSLDPENQAFFLCGVSQDDLLQYTKNSEWRIVFSVSRDGNRSNILVTRVPNN